MGLRCGPGHASIEACRSSRAAADRLSWGHAYAQDGMMAGLARGIIESGTAERARVPYPKGPLFSGQESSGSLRSGRDTAGPPTPPSHHHPRSLCLPACRDDVLPCRVYLRHCVLAAQRLGPAAFESFLDGTYLADRVTTVRQHLAANPTILQELPPPSLIGRYSG